jgi:hypothetical protein
VSWKRGRKDVQRLLDDGELERVAPSPEVADRLLHDAEAHIRLGNMGVEDDPAGALQLASDAARKAAAALLATQGLRATTRGGHIAVLDAVRVQFNDNGGMAVFAKINRLRRRRNMTEYPAADSPGVTPQEARQALSVAQATVDAAHQLLLSGKLGPFA